MKRRDLLFYCASSVRAMAGTGAEAPGTLTCQFQARATVQLFSVPVFTRADVGRGYLRTSAGEQGGRRMLRFEFGAGSLPARAGGLNRLGVMEETVEEGASGVESATYFGFMTASSEQSLDEARAALKRAESPGINAVRGRIVGGRVTNQLVKISGLAPETSWADHERLKPLIEERLRESANNEEAVPTGATGCGTFLHAVYCALRRESPHAKQGFIHNGKIHWLQTERKNGGTLAAEIRSATGERLSAFTLWVDRENQPIRFEFRPRSYLRLTFERV